MLKHTINSTLMATVMLLAVSCKKDDTPFEANSTATPPQLAVNATSITLDPTVESETVLTYQWNKTSFGNNIAVSYSLELDMADDTSGADGWKKAKSIAIAQSDSTYSYTGKDLNYLLSDFSVSAGSTANLVARIKASVNQNTGSDSRIAPVYSNLTSTVVSTYTVDMFVPGSYQNWDPATAPIIAAITGRPGLFECYVYIAGTDNQSFKYTTARDWNHTNYGDGGNGTLTTDGAAAGMVVPTGGYYELTADLNTNLWTAVPTTWGIIGDATPGGWSGDTPLAYDTDTQVWKVTCNMITAGSFKFRANGQWIIDFGVDANGNLKYADNPFFGYDGSLNNITVPEDGNYTITLDLHVPGKYTYTAVKN